GTLCHSVRVHLEVRFWTHHRSRAQVRGKDAILRSKGSGLSAKPAPASLRRMSPYEQLETGLNRGKHCSMPDAARVSVVIPVDRKSGVLGKSVDLGGRR